MTGSVLPPEGSLPTLDYFVEGMDCPTCVRKIEGALERLPGAQNARTNLTTQTLTLTLDEATTPRALLEKNLRALGHEPRLLSGAVNARSVQPTPWYRGRQGQLVLTSGALLVLAYLFGLLEPGLAFWGYLAATLLGTWPLARKAYAAARAGDPFSINTLVTLAAVGALIIGQAEFDEIERVLTVICEQQETQPTQQYGGAPGSIGPGSTSGSGTNSSAASRQNSAKFNQAFY